jgi:hypothetical protein
VLSTHIVERTLRFFHSRRSEKRAGGSQGVSKAVCAGAGRGEGAGRSRDAVGSSELETSADRCVATPGSAAARAACPSLPTCLREAPRGHYDVRMEHYAPRMSRTGAERSVSSRRPSVSSARRSVSSRRPCVSSARRSVSSQRPCVSSARRSVSSQRPCDSSARRSVSSRRPCDSSARPWFPSPHPGFPAAFPGGSEARRSASSLRR